MRQLFTSRRAITAAIISDYQQVKASHVDRPAYVYGGCIKHDARASFPHTVYGGQSAAHAENGAANIRQQVYTTERERATLSPCIALKLKRSQCALCLNGYHLKPNSITLAGSKLVADLQRAEV